MLKRMSDTQLVLNKYFKYIGEGGKEGGRADSLGKSRRKEQRLVGKEKRRQ